MGAAATAASTAVLDWETAQRQSPDYLDLENGRTVARSAQRVWGVGECSRTVLHVAKAGVWTQLLQALQQQSDAAALGWSPYYMTSG